MSTLTIPVQTKQTLTGTYAKSGNDLYFISEEPDLFPPNPARIGIATPHSISPPTVIFPVINLSTLLSLMSKPALNPNTSSFPSMPTFTPPSLSPPRRSMMILIPALPVSPSAPARTWLTSATPPRTGAPVRRT